MKVIYVVDGSVEDREGIKQYLELSGYEVQAYEDLHGVQMAISRQSPDLLLLDVQLPDGDGFNFLKKLKQSFMFPVIFVTGRVAESDRILGFELGADDYVCKPFSSKELVLRVHALFRRIDVSVSAFRSGSTWTLGNSVLQLDEVSHLFNVDGHQVPLTAAE